jgi:hypothetical protein
MPAKVGGNVSERYKLTGTTYMSSGGGGESHTAVQHEGGAQGDAGDTGAARRDLVQRPHLREPKRRQSRSPVKTSKRIREWVREELAQRGTSEKLEEGECL